MVEIVKKIWEVKLVREIVLLIATAVAAAFVTSAGPLLDIVNTKQTYADLISSFNVWLGSFVLAAIQTVVRQLIAFALAHLAGSHLGATG